MKAAPFDFVRAGDVDEVCRLLQAADGEAQIIAGGQSLVPLMAARMARPALLIDINHIAALSGISVEADRLRIGACTRQRAVEQSAMAARACPLLTKAISQIGHIQTRNRGTVGGSLCQADPASEIPLVAVTLGATLIVQGSAGERSLPAREFFHATMTTALAPDDCLIAVTFPVWQDERVGTSFHEVSMRRGDFAMVSAAAQLALDEDGICRRAAMGLGAVAPSPIYLDAASAALVGQVPTYGVIDQIAAQAVSQIDPETDVHASADYRRRVAPKLLRRAMNDALVEARAKAP
jgi:CO/xanthine dehydrogenase FAD-binding subunit